MISEHQKRALRWFRENGPADLFDAKAPRRAMREKLEQLGYIKPVASKSQFVMYAISERGERALEQDRRPM